MASTEIGDGAEIWDGAGTWDGAAGSACAGEDDRRRVRELCHRVGDKWSLVVLAELGDGPVRFTTLLGRVEGISHRLLAVTLRRLERDGLVARTVYPEVPPRVEYAMTGLGASLLVPLAALAGWGERHGPTIDAHRRADDRRRGVGRASQDGVPEGR
ncbi:winged helix-turn-helix transcriptional regulator [Isoptericola sp. NPDC058082]|uniref:winged helix-turn-helix transcriptional regulator n=1 Tax=Isoptericola sp. NPDC058082 TaxID=3346331 RepID=UPI0036E8A83B